MNARFVQMKTRCGYGTTEFEKTLDVKMKLLPPYHRYQVY